MCAKCGNELAVQRQLRPEEAAVGALFHLDRGFRRGVVAMVRRGVAEARVPLVYVPAVVIGSPVVH